MRERGPSAAGQDGREPPAIQAHRAVPDREHPAVDADEPPGRHAVLLARDPSDPPIYMK